MKNIKGFTLVETIIAIFILTIGIVGIFSVLQNMSYQANNYSNYLTASYLAQEGMEIIRNMRDDNWVKNIGDWQDGINNGSCESGCHFEADYKTGISGQLLPYINEGRFLNIDADNIYSYDTIGNYSETIFKREIIVTGSNNIFGSSDVFKVDSIVSWQYKGKQFFVQIAEFLYNWY